MQTTQVLNILVSLIIILVVNLIGYEEKGTIMA